jgi:hypothetical protein
LITIILVLMLMFLLFIFVPPLCARLSDFAHMDSAGADQGAGFRIRWSCGVKSPFPTRI